MVKYIKRIVVKYGKQLCTLAVIIAPIATRCCRGMYYEPEIPEGMNEFLEKK